MSSYTAPVGDTRFVLDEIIGLDRLTNTPGFESASADIVQAVLEEGGKFASGVMFPLNAVGDTVGCKREDDGRVIVPPGFKDAFDQFVEGGWTTLHAPEQWGGQALPMVVATAVSEYFVSANHALEMYNGLTGGAIEAILAVGSDALKQKYVPNMVAGKWGGTMNLTEPHAAPTSADQAPAPSRRPTAATITGTKIFISGGEHDLTENIIHLVLAKTPGAPEAARASRCSSCRKRDGQ
jgi:alkylation response protein AidB-like acyl-CoA dehydrogenase